MHHRKAVMALLSWKLETGDINTALIQAPWIYADWIRWLHNIRGQLFYTGPSITPRSWIFVRNTTHAFPLSGLYSRDVGKVRMTYTRGRNKRELTVISAYLPYDSDKPPLSYRLSEVTAVGTKCSWLLNVMPVHTTLYGGRTDINPQEEKVKFSHNRPVQRVLGS